MICIGLLFYNINESKNWVIRNNKKEECEMFYLGKIHDGSGDAVKTFYLCLHANNRDSYYPACGLYERLDNGVAYLTEHFNICLRENMLTEAGFLDVYFSACSHRGYFNKKKDYEHSNDVYVVPDSFNTYNTEEGAVLWFKNNGVVFPDDYVCEGSELKITNNTGLSDEMVLDIISIINPQHVNKASMGLGVLKSICSKWQPLMYSDSGNVIEAPGWSRSAPFVYANESYLEWGNKYCRNFLFEDHKDVLKKRFYYFDIDDDQKELLVERIEVDLKNTKNSGGETFEFILKRTYSLKYSLRGGSYCKKHMARSDKDVMPMEMFNINSRNIHNADGEFLFNGSSNMREFFINNYEFFERCGYSGLARITSQNLHLSASFILFISMVFEYPQVEMLAKMGHISLIDGIFTAMVRCSTKEAILDEVKELSALINEKATKGSQILRFPSYIGEYLKGCNAPISDYMFWRDVYELSNISAENFNKFINSSEMVLLNMDTNRGSDIKRGGLNSANIQEILKYGYDFMKTIKYLVKMSLLDNYRNVCEAARIMADTLSLAEQLDITIEKYPDNLSQLHDELSETFNHMKQKIEDDNFQGIVNNVLSALDKAFKSDSVTLPRNAMGMFDCVIPKTRQDFVEEGIKQHNCVGGYYNRVANKECIVFFIRKKESPNDSYITAEVKRDGLRQVMFSNNRPVSSYDDELEWQYACFIATTLKPLLK